MRPFLIILSLALAGPAFAHNPDTSYARVTITSREVAFKFSFDLSTLQRITRIDANGERPVSRAELEAAAPAIQQFLRAHFVLSLNQHEAELVVALPPVWPEDAGAVIPETDHGQRLLSFMFRHPLLAAAEELALTFDVFEQLGAAHTVLSVFAWNDREDEVIFTRFEPDYLYDTGYRVPVSKQIIKYFRLGVKHIFLGCDHIAFLLALLFVKRFLDLVKVITAFTVAHPLTLALAVLHFMPI